MISITITELLNSSDVLQKLSKMELKAKLAWTVGRLLKAVDKELNGFNETRTKLIMKYGEKDETGNLKTDENGNCQIVKESLQAFTDELNELLASSVEINANKLQMDAIENIDFTPAEMTQLEPFIDIEE